MQDDQNINPRLEPPNQSADTRPMQTTITDSNHYVGPGIAFAVIWIAAFAASRILPVVGFLCGSNFLFCESFVLFPIDRFWPNLALWGSATVAFAWLARQMRVCGVIVSAMAMYVFVDTIAFIVAGQFDIRLLVDGP